MTDKHEAAAAVGTLTQMILKHLEDHLSFKANNFVLLALADPGPQSSQIPAVLIPFLSSGDTLPVALLDYAERLISLSLQQQALDADQATAPPTPPTYDNVTPIRSLN